MFAFHPAAAGPPSIWTEGVRDLRDGSARWRVSYLLGVGEIRRRYARSAIGQFWVTLTTGLTVGALGFVWSQLWRQPIANLLPFVAISMVVWGFISGLLNDAPVAFTNAAPLMNNQGMPFSTIMYGLMLKHCIVFAHNLPIIVIVALIFGIWPGPEAVGALVGLALLIAFLFGLSYAIAVVCLRFRDLTQIVQNGVTMLFFVTPVLWRPEQIRAEHAYLLNYNPFAVYLATIQKPLLGGWPTSLEWAIAAGLALVSLVLVVPMAGWARRRIIYWL